MANDGKSIRNARSRFKSRFFSEQAEEFQNDDDNYDGIHEINDGDYQEYFWGAEALPRIRAIHGNAGKGSMDEKPKSPFILSVDSRLGGHRFGVGFLFVSLDLGFGGVHTGLDVCLLDVSIGIDAFLGGSSG